MTGGVLRALQRRHDHAGQTQKLSATNSNHNVSLSMHSNATGTDAAPTAERALVDGFLSPTSPEHPILGLAQTQTASLATSSSNPSTPSTPSISPLTSPGLPPIPAAPRTSRSFTLLPHKKRHSLSMRPQSTALSDSRTRSSSATTPRSTSTTNACSMPSSPGLPSLPVIQRFPSRIELRAQYDRNGQLVRAVEELYEHDATMPCLAYGTPPGPVGSDAFGCPPPYA